MAPLLLMVLLVAAAQSPEPPKTHDRPTLWRGAFTPYPRANRLCAQHVLGTSEGRRVEIDWTAYATVDSPEIVVAFYAREHRATIEAGATTLTVRGADARLILSVHPVASPYPRCDAAPSPRDKTVIIVSQKIP